MTRTLSVGSDVTALLTEIALETREEVLSPRDSELMRLLLLDSLGCALMSGTRAPLRSIVETLSTHDQGQHRVWGTSATASMRTSVMLSAALVHGFEFDDQCLGAGLHAGAATVPAALGLTRDQKVSGIELLTALKSGTEVGIALGRLLSGGPGRRGFHIHCWTGAFASAATGSALLKLSPQQTTYAFGIAGAVTGGFISAQYGTEVKRLQAGRAAEAGVLGAILSASGMEGIVGIVERPDGGIASSIAGMLPNEVASGRIAIDPRQRWADRAIAFKSVPCKIGIQSAYAALDALLTSTGITVTKVDRVRVLAPEHLLHRVGHHYVAGDAQAAQASLRFILAYRLLAGAVDTESFGESQLNDPAIIRFANEQIDLVPDGQVTVEQAAAAWMAEVTLLTTDGEVLISPKGEATPWFPGNYDIDGIKAKFLNQAVMVLSPKQASRLLRAIWGIHEETDAYEALNAAFSI